MILSLLCLPASAAPRGRLPGFLSCSNSNNDAVLPISDNYALYSDGNLARIARKPLAILFPKTEEHVVQIAKCAATHNIQLVPRGGGHSYGNFGAQDGAVTVDLSEMAKVTVINKTSNAALALVQGGARLGNVYYELFQQGGYDFNAGTCPEVGIGGHISGGGIGMSARFRGLAADQVESIRIVLAGGNVAIASANQNQDLFWALRGGAAGSFGIITEFTIKVFRELEYTGFRFVVNNTHAPEFISKWAHYFLNANDRLMSQLNVNKGTSQLQGQFIGSRSDAQKLIKDSGIDQVEGITEQVWEDCTALSAKAFVWSGKSTDLQYLQVPNRMERPAQYKDRGKYKHRYFTKIMPLDGFARVVSEVEKAVPGSWAQFEVLGGKIVGPNDQNAYPHRDVQLSLQMHDRDDQSADWIRNLDESMAIYDSDHRAYYNYVDLDVGKEYGKVYWRDNYPRLRQIKSKYDPLNAFHHETSIKPL